MKLRYAWLDRRYLLTKRREKVTMWVAWHLPRSLVMWCYYRVAAHATTGQYGDTMRRARLTRRTSPSSRALCSATAPWCSAG